MLDERLAKLEGMEQELSLALRETVKKLKETTDKHLDLQNEIDNLRETETRLRELCDSIREEIKTTKAAIDILHPAAGRIADSLKKG